MNIVKKLFLPLFVMSCFNAVPVLAEEKVVEYPEGSAAWQWCAEFIGEAGTFAAALQRMFRPALMGSGDYDIEHIQRLIRMTRNQETIYQEYAKAMSRYCGAGAGELILAIAKYDNVGSIRLQFSDDEDFVFIFDVEELFRHVRGSYAIMIWNNDTKGPGSVITRAVSRNNEVRIFGSQGKRGDFTRHPDTGAALTPDIGFARGSNASHRWWSRQCADWNVAGTGIDNKNGVSVAATAVFGSNLAFGDRYIIDYPLGDNMRAFPGLLLADARPRGNNRQAVVEFQNLRTAMRQKEAFAEQLRTGTRCKQSAHAENRNLVVYLVSLEGTNVEVDSVTGKVIGWGTLGVTLATLMGTPITSYNLWGTSILAASAVKYGLSVGGAAYTTALTAGSTKAVAGAAAVAKGVGGAFMAVPVAGWIVGGTIVAGTAASVFMVPDRITRDLTQVIVMTEPIKVD
jgi:hypothetical protein